MGLWGLSLVTATCHLSDSLLLECAEWPGFLCLDSPPLQALGARGISTITLAATSEATFP